MGLIVSNVAASALETIPSINARWHGFFAGFEQFSLLAYTFEYCVRMWSSVEDPRVAARGGVRGRLSFALRPLMIIDFLAFAPGYLGFFGIDLRALRIFRVFRLLKLARYSQAIQALIGVLVAERSSLFASMILLLATVCLDGELMHLAEGGIQPHTLGTMPDGMYWALTTLATVGYGDITPVTPLGKFIAGFTMVTGLCLFALPIGIIANGFVKGLSSKRFAITWSMLRRYPLFEGFDVSALSAFVESAGATVIREHALVTVSGKPATEFFLIVSGRACAEYDHGPSREIGPGNIFGEDAMYLDGTYNCTVTAHTELRVIALAGDELRRLMRKYPVLGERIALITGSTVGHAQREDRAGRLAMLELENARLRKAVSDLTLEKMSLQEKVKPGH
jgi:voltage-gated potassium channel